MTNCTFCNKKIGKKQHFYKAKRFCSTRCLDRFKHKERHGEPKPPKWLKNEKWLLTIKGYVHVELVRSDKQRAKDKKRYVKSKELCPFCKIHLKIPNSKMCRYCFKKKLK